MRFTIEKPKTSAAGFFRRAGYSFQKKEGEEMVFVRKLTHQAFPRFHLFVRVVDRRFLVNIHIDHKATSHARSRAHSGEYGEDNELLSSEVERLKNIF